MELKRYYKIPEGWEPLRDDYGRVLNPPPLDYVEVHHTGWTARQNFSTRLVNTGAREGWITIASGQLILNTRPEELVYVVMRGPGRYCCHCKERLEDDALGEQARAHVGQLHKGVLSPDPENPSGYCVLNYYECVLNAEQHARWSLTRDVEGHLSRGGMPYKGGRPIG